MGYSKVRQLHPIQKHHHFAGHNISILFIMITSYRRLSMERVYLPPYKV